MVFVVVAVFFSTNNFNSQLVASRNVQVTGRKGRLYLSTHIVLTRQKCVFLSLFLLFYNSLSLAPSSVITIITSNTGLSLAIRKYPRLGSLLKRRV